MATDATRAELIDAATRAFAEDGVQTASLVEITRRAGQRNRGAVHYHFGGREGLLVAVLDQHSPFLARREGELLEVARARPHSDVASVVEAIVRPCVELAESGWRGACYLAILGELVEQDPAAQAPEVVDALGRTGGVPVYALLAERMPPSDDDLRTERVSLLTSFIVGSIARRARAGDGSRPHLPTARFIDHLIDCATAMATAPVRPA
jgi:AcrR family transcriptional regulator